MNHRIQTILFSLRSQFQNVYSNRLVQLLLYGSQSRGDAASGSDIDVLVVLQGPVDPGEEITRTGPLIAALSLQHGVVLSCAFVSLNRYLKEKSPLLLNIHREGIKV